MTHPLVPPKSGRGATRRTVRPPQARLEKQDVEPYATKFSCSTHQIEYYVPHGARQICPVCEAEQDLIDLRARLNTLENEVTMHRNQLDRIKPQLDLKAAITQAIELLDDNDYAWLKVQLYQYKIDKSVTLKVTHGKLEGGRRPRRGDRLPPNGFMALPRKGDPEGHLATSIGGLATAEYLDEALTTLGSAQAMGIMLKAWWKALPGGLS